MKTKLTDSAAQTEKAGRAESKKKSIGPESNRDGIQGGAQIGNG